MNNKRLTGYPSIDKPWLKYYSEEQLNIHLPRCTMYEHIKKCNSDNFVRIALNYYGSEISYGTLFKSIDRVASALENMGIKKGDIVTVCMINSPETIYILFALNKIGAAANMVCGMDSDKAIKAHIKDADSNYIFVLDIFQNKIQEIIDDTSVLRVVVVRLTQGMSLINQIGTSILKGMKPLTIPNDKRFIGWKQFLSYSNGQSTTVHLIDVDNGENATVMIATEYYGY